MVAASGMLHIAGKTLKEACFAHAVPARFKFHCHLPNQFNQAHSKGLQLLSSFLYYLSLYSIWTGLALELKLEGMSALFSYF